MKVGVGADLVNISVATWRSGGRHLYENGDRFEMAPEAGAGPTGPTVGVTAYRVE